MLQLAQMVDQANGTNLADQIAAGITGGATPTPAAGGQAGAQNTEALGGAEKAEAQNTKKARQRVADSTSPT